MTIKQALSWANQKLKSKNIPSAHLDAEVLLCYLLNVTKVTEVTNVTKEWIYANSAYRLPSTAYRKYKKIIEKRARYEPVAYITSKKEFYGLDFYVNNSLLIPRPETELLVEEVLKAIRDMRYEIRFNIVDVGTGSGCIAISLAKKLAISNKQLTIYATDISKKALEVAKLNAKKHNVQNRITFLQGDLLIPVTSDKIQETRIDIIVANLPYVKDQEMEKLPNGIKKYEPKTALYGGKEGLDYYKKLLYQIRKYLNKKVKIFLEISPYQTDLVKIIAKKYFPQGKIEIKKDYSRLDRIVLISS